MKRQTLTAPFAGEIVFWSVGDTDLGRLEHDFPYSIRDYLPKAPTPAAALKSALGSIYADKRCLIRPLEVDGAYAVVEEYATETGVTYKTRLTAIASGDPATVRVEGGGGYSFEGSDIRDAFLAERAKLPGIAVSKALVKIVVEAFGGVPLRDSGGVYWLPSSASERFARLAFAVEAAGILRDGKAPAAALGALGHTPKINPNKVYSVFTPADENTCRAVVDALTAEVSVEVARTGEEVTATGDAALGNRALMTRQSACVDLADKVARYEKIFGVALGDLVSSITTVKAAAMAAALAGAPDVDGDGEGVEA